MKYYPNQAKNNNKIANENNNNLNNKYANFFSPVIEKSITQVEINELSPIQTFAIILAFFGLFLSYIILSSSETHNNYTRYYFAFALLVLYSLLVFWFSAKTIYLVFLKVYYTLKAAFIEFKDKWNEYYSIKTSKKVLEKKEILGNRYVEEILTDENNNIGKKLDQYWKLGKKNKFYEVKKDTNNQINHLNKVSLFTNENNARICNFMNRALKNPEVSNSTQYLNHITYSQVKNEIENPLIENLKDDYNISAYLKNNFSENKHDKNEKESMTFKNFKNNLSNQLIKNKLSGIIVNNSYKNEIYNDYNINKISSRNDILIKGNSILNNFIINKIYSNPSFKNELEEIENLYKFKPNSDFLNLGFRWNMKKCVTNFKNYLIHQMLQKLADFHISNFCNINELMKNYSLEIAEDLTLAFPFLDNLEDLITERISGSNLFHNYFPQKKNETIYIFWGDSKALEFIVEKVEERLKNLRLMSNDDKYRSKLSSFNENNLTNSQKINFSQNKRSKSTDIFKNLVSKSIDQVNFLRESFHHTIMLKNKTTEENLVKLISELNQRIHFGKLIFPDNFVSRISNKEEYFILLEYILNRIITLQKNNLKEFKFNSGGVYRQHQWINFFPTDSLIICYLVAKQLAEASVNKETLTKCFMLSYPYSNKIDVNSIFIYHVSSEYHETYFNLSNKSTTIELKKVIFLT